jgi:hypothetical protein
MTKPNDGGPAFPQHKFESIPGGSGAGNWVNTGGMTLRDWFAGQALAGILADDSLVSPEMLKMFGSEGKTRGDIASVASYAYADAMLTAREAKP